MVGQYGVYIGGKWVEAESKETAEVIDPANGLVIALAAKCGPSDVDKAVRVASEAAPGRASKTVGERSKGLLRLSQLIMAHHEELARLETMEHGSPIRKTITARPN
jgi:acyl-CoA reductase-like NAD-dependent aldehyde dehydrogenase